MSEKQLPESESEGSSPLDDNPTEQPKERKIQSLEVLVTEEISVKDGGSDS